MKIKSVITCLFLAATCQAQLGSEHTVDFVGGRATLKVTENPSSRHLLNKHSWLTIESDRELNVAGHRADIIANGVRVGVISMRRKNPRTIVLRLSQMMKSPLNFATEDIKYLTVGLRLSMSGASITGGSFIKERVRFQGDPILPAKKLFGGPGRLGSYCRHTAIVAISNPVAEIDTQTKRLNTYATVSGSVAPRKLAKGVFIVNGIDAADQFSFVNICRMRGGVNSVFVSKADLGHADIYASNPAGREVFVNRCLEQTHYCSSSDRSCGCLMQVFNKSVAQCEQEEANYLRNFNSNCHASAAYGLEINGIRLPGGYPEDQPVASKLFNAQTGRNNGGHNCADGTARRNGLFAGSNLVSWQELEAFGIEELRVKFIPLTLHNESIDPRIRSQHFNRVGCAAGNEIEMTVPIPEGMTEYTE